MLCQEERPAQGQSSAVPPLQGPPTHLLRRKRLVDLCLLALLGPPALLAVFFCALATRLLTGGPALYKQTRVGYRGRHIEVWKLRTMKLDAERILEERLLACPQTRQEWDQNFKLKNDPRIIPYLGSFLRKSSLDELPQLFNVVKGEMSFVGPRPLPIYHQQIFEPAFQQLRQSVPPGLSGLWQINERSDGDLASHQKWDTQYITQFSLINDLKIILATPLIILKCRGAR